MPQERSNVDEPHVQLLRAIQLATSMNSQPCVTRCVPFAGIVAMAWHVVYPRSTHHRIDAPCYVKLRDTRSAIPDMSNRHPKYTWAMRNRNTRIGSSCSGSASFLPYLRQPARPVHTQWAQGPGDEASSALKSPRHRTLPPPLPKLPLGSPQPSSTS